MKKQTKDDEVYTLTPWGIMYVVLMNYGFDPKRLTRHMGEHLVDDFMEGMVRGGYVRKVHAKTVIPADYGEE